MAWRGKLCSECTSCRCFSFGICTSARGHWHWQVPAYATEHSPTYWFTHCGVTFASILWRPTTYWCLKKFLQWQQGVFLRGCCCSHFVFSNPLLLLPLHFGPGRQVCPQFSQNRWMLALASQCMHWSYSSCVKQLCHALGRKQTDQARTRLHHCGQPVYELFFPRCRRCLLRREMLRRLGSSLEPMQNQCKSV